MNNVLFEDENRDFTEPCVGYGTWKAYGGHRLWLSPETNPETYFPDNSPVEYIIDKNEITLLPAQTAFGKQFELKVKMSESEPLVQIVHRIENTASCPQIFSPWSITSLTQGGTCMIPLSKRKSGYLPNRALSLWDYSDIKDSRFTLENDFAVLKQNPLQKEAFKAGFNVEEGFVAYDVHGQMFVKSVPLYKNVRYPDFSSNFEVYTNNLFLECETVGEIRCFNQNESAYLEESWGLLLSHEVYKDGDTIHQIFQKINHSI